MEHLQDIISQYGYWAIYILLALGIVGLPVPDEILMTIVGYFCSINILRYSWSLLIAFSGTMTGMTISYTLGKKLGKPLLLKYGKWVKLTPAKLNKIDRWFNKYGLWTVVFGYYIPGIRHLTCYMAGITGVKTPRYLLFAASGALVWCITFITIGYYFGILHH
ncbi:DedA family protein [Paenibacillus senegalensis]|uniref:DedA family protein n=1 Tax=Paenibacillus senegalensis TaxID=1465766 RepID=UPI0004749119|nr:DedA family protein [Paenibacillus senegalensis]